MGSEEDQPRTLPLTWRPCAVRITGVQTVDPGIRHVTPRDGTLRTQEIVATGVGTTVQDPETWVEREPFAYG